MEPIEHQQSAPEYDFNPELICVIEQGNHMLYTKTGERLNRLVETRIYQSAPEHELTNAECEFMIITSDITEDENLPYWRFGISDRFRHLVSPKGEKYFFNYINLLSDDPSVQYVRVFCRVVLMDKLEIKRSLE